MPAPDCSPPVASAPQPTSAEVAAGHAVYTPAMLGWYDFLVLNVSCRWIWRCPREAMQALYDRHLSRNHLEVGVGTGYFLDHLRAPVDPPHITLADLNPNCLAQTAQRIARYHPRTLVANVLEPFPWTGPAFDSIGLNFVLHCVPGDFSQKGVAFQHLARVLSPAGVLFGSTLLSEGVPRSFLSRRLMAVYNAKGIFANRHDSLEGLRHALEAHFAQVEITTRGCGALFVARQPRLATG